MNNNIIELAEKIYASRISNVANSASIEDYHIKMAQNSILAAKVFYLVKKEEEGK